MNTIKTFVVTLVLVVVVLAISTALSGCGGINRRIASAGGAARQPCIERLY